MRAPRKAYGSNSFFQSYIKICTTNKIFVYFRLLFTKQQIAILNNVVRTREKIKTLKFYAAIVKACISQRVGTKYTVALIKRSRARHSIRMEHAFSTDDVEKKRAFKKTTYSLPITLAGGRPVDF